MCRVRAGTQTPVPSGPAAQLGASSGPAQGQLGASSGPRHPAAAGSGSGNADPEGLGDLITKGVFKTGFYHERICFTTRYSRGFHLLQGISRIRITVTEIRT